MAYSFPDTRSSTPAPSHMWSCFSAMSEDDADFVRLMAEQQAKELADLSDSVIRCTFMIIRSADCGCGARCRMVRKNDAILIALESRLDPHDLTSRRTSHRHRLCVFTASSKGGRLQPHFHTYIKDNHGTGSQLQSQRFIRSKEGTRRRSSRANRPGIVRDKPRGRPQRFDPREGQYGRRIRRRGRGEGCRVRRRRPGSRGWRRPFHIRCGPNGDRPQQATGETAVRRRTCGTGNFEAGLGFAHETRAFFPCAGKNHPWTKFKPGCGRGTSGVDSERSAESRCVTQSVRRA